MKQEPVLSHAPPPPRKPIAPAGPNKRPRRGPRAVSVKAELSRGLRFSLFLHGLLAVTFLVNTVIDRIDPDKSAAERAMKSRLVRNAIRVDVVDLPSLKPEQLAMVDPTIEPAKDGKGDSKPPEPSKDAMEAPSEKKDAKGAKADAKEKKPEKGEKAAPDKSGVKDVRERLRAEQKRRELMAKLQGEGGSGRPLLAGNKISEGYSVTGDVAKDQDIYVGKIEARLRQFWTVPAWMDTGKLTAKVLVRIAPDGRVVSKEFLSKSGNSEFDGYVFTTIDRASPLPPPPETLRRQALEDGFEWGFPK